MGSPTIFSGTRTKLLSANGLLLSSGSINDYDGSVNYIKNGHAEVNTLGWATYADAAGTSPVDGTGGSPNSTWTRTTTSPLRLTSSFLFTRNAGASRQGEGVSYGFTIDSADKARVLQIEFDYILSSGTFAAGSIGVDSELTVWIYDITNAKLIQPYNYKLQTSSTTLPDRFISSFQTSINSTSYRLIIHCGSTNTTGFVMEFDDFKVGPVKYVYGASVSDWKSYTPTGSWVTNTTYQTSYWRRVGDSMEVTAYFTLSGAPNAVDLTFSVPTGYIIDTSKITGTAPYQAPIGEWSGVRAGTTVQSGIVGIASSSTVKLLTNNITAYVNATNPNTWGSGDLISVHYTIPITGWSSSVQQSDSYDGKPITARYTNTAGTAYSAGVEADVPFATKDFDTTNSFSTPSYIVPSSGKYTFKVILRTASTVYNNQGAAIFIRKNGTNYSRLCAFNGQSATAASYVLTGTDTLDLNANDIISFRFISDVAVNLSTTAGDCNFSVVKMANPSVITPTETIACSAILTSNLTINASTDFAGLSGVLDTHGALNLSTGVWTCPYPGFYRISAFFRLDTGASAATQHVITAITTGSISGLNPINTTNVAASKSYNYSFSYIFSAIQGETLKLSLTSATNASTAQASQCNISIERIK